MNARVETLTPANTPMPIGHYNRVAKAGEHIWIGGTAGVDPATAPSNHSPKYFLDEGSLAVGTEAMLQASLDFLGYQ